MPVHSQDALTQAIYNQSLEKLPPTIASQCSAIEKNSDQALASAESSAAFTRGTVKGVAIAYSLIPVVGNALSELTKSAAELVTVDAAAYEREKTKKIAEFIEHHKAHYQLEPASVQTLLESALESLKKPADSHLYLHMELTKNLGSLLLEGREHFDFKVEELQQLLRLEADDRQVEKRRVFEREQYDGLGSAFGLLAGVGRQAKNSVLAKLGHVGQISVEIARAGSALKSAMNVGGLLSFLNPASAMGAGLLSLVSLFGASQPTESEVILKAIQSVATQLREFRFETKIKLAEIDTHLLGFADSMTRHYLTLLEKLSMSEQYLHDFVKDRFNQLDASVAELDDRQTQIGRLLLSQETRQLIHAVNSNPEGSAFFTGLSSDNYYKHLNSFTFWMSDVSHHELHNGLLHVKTTPDATTLAIKRLEGKDPYQFLSMLFYCLDAQLREAEMLGLSKKITPFDSVLVNPFLWLRVTDAYLKLVLSAPQYFEDNPEVRRSSIHEADKLMDAARRLQTSPMIYGALFDLYQAQVSAVREILLARQQALREAVKIDLFGDLEVQVNAYEGRVNLPLEATLAPQWAQFFSTQAISSAGFQEFIAPYVPRLAVLLCDLKLGSLKLEVSVRDGQVGSYGQHLPHVSKEDAKRRQFSYALDGFPEIRDYLYFERIFDFSVLFVPTQNQTQPIKVADVSLSSLLTQDRKGDGDKFRDVHADLNKIKERLFFREKKKTGGRRYLVAGPRHSKTVIFDAAHQLAFSVQAPMKRFIAQAANDAGLQSCRQILDQHLLSEKKKYQQKLENKMQSPGLELDSYINKIRAIAVVLKGCLEVAGFSAEQAVRAPVSRFFAAVPRLSEFQRSPDRAFDALMSSQDLVLGQEEQEQLKQHFERALLDPANGRHPLETVFNESVDQLVVLPRVINLM